jgi:peptidoglycan/xylan/chitin deacetylase (PgdA/CDA1 family)
MAGRRSSFFARARAGLALAAALSACSTPAPAPPAASPTIEIWVEGIPRDVAPGTTFGEALVMFDVHAEPGRLLSVSGSVLERRADPGRVTLNGTDAFRRAVLAAGDAISAVDGLDTVEGTKRVVEVLKGLRPRNPQYTLRTFPMKAVRVVGRISGEMVSVEYRPVGRPKVPGAVALTFDDGPWGGQTRRVLRVLGRYDVRATFFLVGSQIERYPGVARRIVRAGHRIGNHSWSHPQHPRFSRLRPHRLSLEIARTNRWLDRIGVERPFLLRAPGGSVDGGVVAEAHRRGLRVVQWSVDPQDWRPGKPARRIADAVLRRVRPGSIVLLHDGGGDRSATIRALPTIIRGIRKMGLKLVPIPR